MEFDLWWLLALPVFFGMGWLAARLDVKKVLRERRQLPQSYLQGLSFLVSEEPDRAIESFLAIADLNPEMVDLHLALGKLFRRNGEFERAIRLHQALLSRPGTAAAHKEEALFELGLDYLRAGLLDRAETSLRKLLDSDRAVAAARELKALYVRQRDWAAAAEMGRILRRSGDESAAAELAHFLCEEAEPLLTSDVMRADALLREAEKVHPQSVRATLLRGDLEARRERPQAALQAWTRVEKLNPDFLAQAGERLLRLQEERGRPAEAIALLRRYLQKYPSVDLLDVTFKAVRRLEGGAQAYALVREDLRRHPTLLGLSQLLAAQVSQIQPDRRADMEIIRDLIEAHSRRLSVYGCRRCGFRAGLFYWHCPGCGSWDSIPPRRLEEALPAAGAGGPAHSRR